MATATEPTAAERHAAYDFLTAHDRRGARIFRIERVAPMVVWIIYTLGSSARHAVVVGNDPSGWELIADAKGWPVVV